MGICSAGCDVMRSQSHRSVGGEFHSTHLLEQAGHDALEPLDDQRIGRWRPPIGHDHRLPAL